MNSQELGKPLYPELASSSRRMLDSHILARVLLGPTGVLIFQERAFPSNRAALEALWEEQINGLMI